MQLRDTQRLHAIVHALKLGYIILSFWCIFPLDAALSQPDRVSLSQDDGVLTIAIDNRPALAYQYEAVSASAGVDSAYARSGFIHPLRTLTGHVLTQIQPEDHYHHYGLWNPWTHVAYAGDTLDFWNLGKRQGTVRFVKFDSTWDDPGSAGFEALHAHVAYPYSDAQVALHERQRIEVRASDDGFYTLDLTIDLTCATDEPFHILQYRYGGLGWRATGAWNADNCTVTTSEGRTRENADGSRARWCIVQGALGKAEGGILVMSHPENYNHPEPLRIWPPDYEGEGELMFNFAPAKTTDWLLQPGKTYSLRYRLVVFDGTMERRQAEPLWSDYVKS